MAKRKPAIVQNMKVEDWDQKWVKIEGGFSVAHDQLKYKIGLYKGVLRGELKIIGEASSKQGGLYKRLAQLRGRDTTSNQNYAARCIREHIQQLDLWVLVVGEGLSAVEETKELGRQMRALHPTPWDKRKHYALPQKSRPARRRNGTLSLT